VADSARQEDFLFAEHVLRKGKYTTPAASV